MVESAPLLREYALKAYRGFESLTLRHIKKSILCRSRGWLFSFRGRPPIYPPIYFHCSTWPVKSFVYAGANKALQQASR